MPAPPPRRLLCALLDGRVRHLRLLSLWLPEPHAHALPTDLRGLAGIAAEHDATLRVRIDPP